VQWRQRYGDAWITIQAFEHPRRVQWRSGGCASGGLNQKIDVLEWAKSWQSLGPGESLSVSYSRRDLFNFQEDAEDYQFWGEYVPPKLTIDEISLLESAGINFPRVTLASAHLNFKRLQ
jgi:hypothetical protein